MAEVAPIRARRVRDRLLCGWRVLGDYSCTGEIAQLRPGPNRWLAIFGGEYVQDHPSGEVRLAARAARKLAEGRAPKANQKTGRVVGGQSFAVPWTRRCPHCNRLNLVDAHLLES